jgi:N-acetylglucosamine kinase-like BadF-type ATPase
VIRAGGWGNIIDDEGSAYDIGKLAIRSALRALDGREDRTLLSRLLVRHFRLRTLQNIVHEVYEKPMSVNEISAISKLVAYAASRGDRVAQSIFAQEGRALAKLVSAIARRLKMTGSKPDVYCVGGVFNAGPILMNPFKQELRKSIPRFTIRSLRFEPAIGSFVVGLQEQHVAAQGRVLANLQTSYARHFGKKH